MQCSGSVVFRRLRSGSGIFHVGFGFCSISFDCFFHFEALLCHNVQRSPKVPVLKPNKLGADQDRLLSRTDQRSGWVPVSVVDPKLFITDPDPTCQ
jgi:hypothetical protein